MFRSSPKRIDSINLESIKNRHYTFKQKHGVIFFFVYIFLFLLFCLFLLYYFEYFLKIIFVFCFFFLLLFFSYFVFIFFITFLLLYFFPYFRGNSLNSRSDLEFKEFRLLSTMIFQEKKGNSAFFFLKNHRGKRKNH